MLRPDRQKALVTLVALAVISVGIVAAVLAGDAPTVFAPVVGGLFAVPIVLVVTALVRGRITLTAQEIVVRGLGTRRRSRAHVTEVVRATISAPRAGATDNLFLLDAHRKPVIRVSDTNYTRGQLDRLVDALGVPCGGPRGPVSAQQLAEAYPGLVSRAERHPYRVALAGFALGVVIVLAVVGVALVS